MVSFGIADLSPEEVSLKLTLIRPMKYNYQNTSFLFCFLMLIRALFLLCTGITKFEFEKENKMNYTITAG